MKFSYYPGCSLHGSSSEYDRSTREVCDVLGVELTELDDWSCCGATSAHSLNHELSLALPARNLALASQQGQDLVAPCAACFNRLQAADQAFWGEDPHLRAVVAASGVTIGERVDVRCLLDALVNVVGLDAIQAKVQKPLAGLKTVAYYGCLLVRPHAVTRFDDPEDPQTMDRLLTALGAEVRPWYHKTECCGAGLSLTKTDVMVRLAGELLAQAKAAGADCIVTACPFCQFNLDSRQAEAAALRGDKFGVPIVYFTQLMGLAFGLSPKQLGLDRHLVSVKPLLAALRREQPTTTAP